MSTMTCIKFRRKFANIRVICAKLMTASIINASCNENAQKIVSLLRGKYNLQNTKKEKEGKRKIIFKREICINKISM